VDVTYRTDHGKWIIEVWMESYPEQGGDLDPVYDEDTYIMINDWCEKNFKYPSRTEYNVFEVKNQKHLEWFLLRWS
jgi:hypothetical protein